MRWAAAGLVTACYCLQRLRVKEFLQICAPKSKKKMPKQVQKQANPLRPLKDLNFKRAVRRKKRALRAKARRLKGDKDQEYFPRGASRKRDVRKRAVNRDDSSTDEDEPPSKRYVRAVNQEARDNQEHEGEFDPSSTAEQPGNANAEQTRPVPGPSRLWLGGASRDPWQSDCGSTANQPQCPFENVPNDSSSSASPPSSPDRADQGWFSEDGQGLGDAGGSGDGGGGGDGDGHGGGVGGGGNGHYFLPQNRMDDHEDLENELFNRGLPEIQPNTPLAEYTAFLTECSQIMTREQVQTAYEWINENARAVVDLVASDSLPKTARSLSDKAKKHHPKIVSKYWCEKISKDDEGRAIVIGSRSEECLAIPVPTLRRANERVYKSVSSITIKELIKYHTKQHPVQSNCGSTPFKLVLSSDGVKANNSTAKKLDIVSILFVCCGVPYPVAVWDYRGEDKPPLEEYYGPIIQEIIELQDKDIIRLEFIATDSKERKIIKGMTACSGFYSCDFCTAKMSGGAFSFDRPGNMRTVEGIEAILAEPARMKKKSETDFAEGIQSWTPVLLLNNPEKGFCFIWDLPIDSLHNLHEGHTKKTVDRLFYDCDGRDVINNRFHQRDRELQRVNNLLEATKLPTIFARRTRKIDMFNMKASEWQTLDSFFFVPMALMLEEDRPGRRAAKLLAKYAFLVRALYSDDETFEEIDDEMGLDRMLTSFCLEYISLYGDWVNSYNLHTFTHILDCRRRTGALWKTSTSVFESSYSILTKCYYKGASNVPKQILENFYSRDRARHVCAETNRRSPHVKPGNNMRSDDSLVKAFGDYYRVEAASVRQGEFQCRKLFTKPLDTSDSLELDYNWSMVGIRTNTGRESSHVKIIKYTDMQCNLVSVADLLIEAPREWLVT